MRTLLLDNYDSYTYNLYQLMAEVFGTEPVVVRNDEPLPAPSELAAFAAAVISPGPGHPGRPRDFGSAAALVAGAGGAPAPVRLPVLGVCLGHQGLGLAEGASVGPAPEPRHGYVSRIRHDGRGLFTGVPQDFAAVRYHSLRVAEPLPDTLVATAWAEDGVLMAMRHRTLPLWGVQFHPESVLTEYGALLLENFGRLAARGRSPGPRRRRIGGSAAGEPAAAARRRPLVPARKPRLTLRVATLDAEIPAAQVFAERFAASGWSFWLDSALSSGDLSSDDVSAGGSSAGRRARARFSFLGDASGPLAETVRYDVRARTVHVERAGEPERVLGCTIFDYLAAELARRAVPASPGLPFAFTGGYVGYLGYEVKADCGSAGPHRAATPDACWMFADRLIVVDHAEHRTYLVCLTEDTPAGHEAATAWLSRTSAALVAAPAPPAPSVLPAPSAPAAEAAGADGGTPEPHLVRDQDRYLRDIAACQEALRAGESYEVCLTDAVRVPASAGDPLGYYQVLRELNPAPYAAFLRCGDVAVASSSPECFLTVSAAGEVRTRPIKGTARRDPDPDRDAELRDALTTEAKTRAENLMIVDLLRNDLGRVCRPGSVEVTSLMAAETYATVHQLVSTVRGRLGEGVSAVDCVRACFPGGSMTGAPKLRTMEIIDRLETQARGVYSGALGYFSVTGAVDLSIVIRTAVFARGEVQVGAGGAIVLDSHAEEEYQEMLLKLAAPWRAYQAWRQAESVVAR